MWYSGAKINQRKLEEEISRLSLVYDADGTANSLEGMVDQIKELTGLNLRLKLFESKVERHREAFDNISGDLNDLEIGKQILTNTGIAGPQSRASLPRTMRDMMDSSIPLLNPLLCDVFLQRIRDRFDLPSDAHVCVRGSRGSHSVRLHSVANGMASIRTQGDTPQTYDVAAGKVFISSGDRSVSLAHVLRTMCPGPRVRQQIQR